MFKVKLTGLTGQIKEFASASKKLETIVSQELEGMATDFVAGAVRDAPVDEGRLKGSIGYSGSGMKYEVFAATYYAPFMEFGTKGKYRPIPGTEAIAAQFKGYKRGDIKAMFKAIAEWVRRKGITGRYSVKTRRRVGNKKQQADENAAAAWPIMLSILRNGVSPQPFFFKQQDIVWPAMIRRVEQRLAKETGVSVILPGDIKRPKIVTI